MHRNTKVLLGVFLTVVLSSCGNFQMPESLAVKTNAKFQVPLGVASYDLSQTIGSAKMHETIQGFMGDATVYDYVSPDSPDTLSYMIRFPGMAVPVDVGSIVQNMNLDSALGDFNQDIKLKAGETINKTLDINVDIPDFSDKLPKPTKADTTTPEFLSEGSVTLEEGFLPTVNIDCTAEGITYNKTYYESGILKIQLTEASGNSYSPNFKLKLLATLKDESGNVIAMSNSGAYQDIVTDPVLRLPLNTEDGLPNKLKITFKGMSEGGNPSEKHKVKADASFENLVPKKITGLTATASALGLSDNILDMDESVDLSSSLPDALKSISFDNAKIDIKIANPSGWSGVKLTLEDPNGLKMEGASDSNLTQTPKSDSNMLNTSFKWGATLTPSSSLKAKIHPTLNINNATVALMGGKTNIALTGEVKISLTNVKSATVDLDKLGFSGFSLPTDGSLESVEIPSELTDFVKKITFKDKKSDPSGNPTATSLDGFGLRCTVSNSLPAGNNIGLNIKAFKKDSSTFCFNTRGEIEAGANGKKVEWKDYPEITFPKSEKYLSFSILIDNANNFELKNIDLGKEYELKIKLEKLLFDWDSVNLNLSNFSKDGEADFNFSISSLMDGFSVAQDALKNVGIHSFPMYLFAQKTADSALFNGMDLSGKLYLEYKVNGTTKYYDFMNEVNPEQAPGAEKTIKIVNPVAWPEDSTKEIVGNKTDPKNLAYYMEENRYSVKAELNKILSLENAEEMKLKYKIGIDGGSDKTVYASQIDSSKNEDLAVDYGMLLSFDFDLKAPISVNIMEFADENYNTPDENGKYSDLLQRTDASSTAEFADYVNFIKYVGFDYTVNNRLLKNLDLTAKIVDKNGATGLNKKLNFKTGRHAASESDNQFSGDDIKSVMTQYPFHPDIEIQLGRDFKDGESANYATPERLTVSRSGINEPNALGAQIIIVVQMDGETPISVWQK